MKLKGFIFVAIFSILAALSLSQSQIVSAQTQSAATAPISYFTYSLRGRITLRLFNSNLQMPASGVTVSAKNLSSGRTFSIKTNKNGEYSLYVNQASSSAQYLIKPNYAKQHNWTPVQYKLVVGQNISNLDFVGTMPVASSSAKKSK